MVKKNNCVIIPIGSTGDAAEVEVTIVTWAPDSYGYGDAVFWMRLLCNGFRQTIKMIPPLVLPSKKC